MKKILTEIICIILSCMCLVSCTGKTADTTAAKKPTASTTATTDKNTGSPSEAVTNEAPSEDTVSYESEIISDVTPSTNAPETDAPKEDTPETQPTLSAPSTQRPETEKPQAQRPQTQKPETQKPETQTPETQKPKPDTTRPAIQLPDFEWPEFPTITTAPAKPKPEQTPTEMLLSGIDALHSSIAGMATMTGTTKAADVFEQKTETTQIYIKAGKNMTSYMQTTSQSTLVNISDVAYGSSDSYKYYKDGATEPQILTHDEYTKTLGPTPEKLIPYTINESTITSIKKNGDTVTVTLDPAKGCDQYKNRLVSNAGRIGATFKSMNSVTLTFKFTNESITEMKVSESYTLNYNVFFVPVPITCNSEFTYTFKTGIGISIPKI